ncbi:DUF424 family protein [Candidatus Pacearchaeota archaeon]|nr:DUF424 family protein [Candidatus Pacearchaeota archaeon]
MLCKRHSSYRIVIALCDTSLLGKSFEEGIRQIKINEHFFKGEEITYSEAVQLIKKQILEDASFNIVGHEAIKAAQEAGLITKENVTTIQGIPYALTF